MAFRAKALRCLTTFALAAALAGCAGEYPQSVFRPVTEFAAELDQLFRTIFWWTLAILILVEVAILYVIFRFRERPGQPRPRQTHGNTLVEIVWTIIPAVILIFIALPTIRGIFDSYRPAPEGALIVEAIGHQWWWEFRYPQYELVTANELHLPVDRPVHVKLRSADVLHNFWIPRVAGKRYNFPVPAKRPGENPSGHELFNVLTFTIQEPGIYLGQCAEYCGESHAIMRMRTIAHPQAEFEQWTQTMRGGAVTATPADAPVAAASVAPLASANTVDTSAAAPPQAPAILPPPGDPLAAQGRQLFESRVCIACHAVAGTNARGVLGPNLTRVGARWTIGAGALPMSRENLVKWIKNPKAYKPGALMPGTTEPGAGMPATGLSDQEVEAIAAYLIGLK